MIGSYARGEFMRFLMWSMIGDKASSPYPLPPIPFTPYPQTPGNLRQRLPEGDILQGVDLAAILYINNSWQTKGARHSKVIYVVYLFERSSFSYLGDLDGLPSIKQRPNKQLTHPIIPKIYWISWALRMDVDWRLAFRSMYQVIYLSVRPIAVFSLCDTGVSTFYYFIFIFVLVRVRKKSDRKRGEPRSLLQNTTCRALKSLVSATARQRPRPPSFTFTP